MFKITASNSSAAEAQFLCRIQRKTSWVKADTQIGGTPFFSAASVDLGALRAAVERAKKDRSVKKDAVSSIDARIESLEDQQQRGRRGDDPNTSSAYSALFGQVEGMSDRELQEWASKTASREDDRALEQLVAARRERRDYEDRLAKARDNYASIKTQKLRMDELMSEFRRRDFGDSYSRIQLDSDNFAQWYLLNNISLSQAINQIDQHQHFDTPPPPPPAPSPAPSYSGWSSSSSSSGGWDSPSPSPSPSPSSDWSSSDTF